MISPPDAKASAPDTVFILSLYEPILIKSGGIVTVKFSFDECVFAELLSELAKREKDAGIFPDPEIDLFMKVVL